MNRCLRSLSCLFTVAGLALLSTDATARASQKPHSQKAHEATKKAHAGKETRSHRSAAPGKRRHAKQTSAQRKAKQPEAPPAPREAIASGDFARITQLAREAAALRTRAA